MHYGGQSDHPDRLGRALVRDDSVDEQKVGQEIHLECLLEAVHCSGRLRQQNARVENGHVEEAKEFGIGMPLLRFPRALPTIYFL